jgi:hypothetical protein
MTDTQPLPDHRLRADDSTTDLHRAAQDGDQAAWDELITRYTAVVRGTVASFRLNEHDAADAVQNTWLCLLRSGSTVRDPEKLGRLAGDDRASRVPEAGPSRAARDRERHHRRRPARRRFDARSERHHQRDA